MPPPPFKKIEFKEAMILNEGYLTKPEVVEVRKSRRGATFVKLGKRLSWLARAITGKPPSGRPLTRTSVLEVMRAKLHQGFSASEEQLAVAADDPMQELNYDNSPAVATGTPMKTRKRQRRYRVQAEDVMKLDMPTYGAEGGSATRQVTCLAAATHVWLEIGDMEWFLQAMHHQYTNGGVPSSP